MATTIVAKKDITGYTATSVRMTGCSETVTPDTTATYTFEGKAGEIATVAALLEGGAIPNAILFLGFPSGDTPCNVRWHTTGDGMATMTVDAKKWSASEIAAELSRTFRVSMVETTYELKDHPAITANQAALKEVIMWLATDEKLRLPDSNGDYHYFDADDEEQTVSEDESKAFCKSYLAGITSFVRYFPVIEQVSTYRSPPGMLITGNRPDSFTASGGSFSAFSEDIGTFDTPPVSLNGYSSTNWFKSADEWAQNGDKTWTRTQRWTYTPEGSTGDHAWIYEE